MLNTEQLCSFWIFNQKKTKIHELINVDSYKLDHQTTYKKWETQKSTLCPDKILMNNIMLINL